MEKRKMETVGAEVSLLGFGGMRFPTKEDGRIDRVKASEMLDYALANGVNYFDTAYYYHDSESEDFYGEALSRHDRDSFYLATKLPVWEVKEQADVRKFVEEQLRRLRTDHIDFYLLHALDKGRWENVVQLDVLSALEELRAEGKIRYIGFSFHDSYEVFEEIIKVRKWDFCQIQFNYMDTEEQAGMKGYKLTEELGIPLVIMEPVRGGALANLSPDLNEKFAKLNNDATTASYALRWVGSLPNVKVILSGMSSMEQVQDNLNTFADFKPLNDAEYAVIEEVAAEMKSRVQNGCTGCSYCMPCPFGVNIPECFKRWNQYHIYRSYGVIGFAWDGMPAEQKPAACRECGKCESVCPQKISIRADLKRVAADIDGRIWK